MPPPAVLPLLFGNLPLLVPPLLVALPLVLVEHVLEGVVERGLPAGQLLTERQEDLAPLLERLPVAGIATAATHAGAKGGQAVPLGLGLGHEPVVQALIPRELVLGQLHQLLEIRR